GSPNTLIPRPPSASTVPVARRRARSRIVSSGSRRDGEGATGRGAARTDLTDGHPEHLLEDGGGQEAHRRVLGGERCQGAAVPLDPVPSLHLVDLGVAAERVEDADGALEPRGERLAGGRGEVCREAAARLAEERLDLGRGLALAEQAEEGREGR